MKFDENVSLANLSTMGLGGQARYLTEVESADQVAEAIAWAKSKKVKWLALGGGSNTIFTDSGFDGLVLVNKIIGHQLLSQKDDAVLVKFNSGENWDEAVKRTTDKNFSGIEALSAIPGTVGAAPVQNIGAYGQELVDTFVELEAYDSANDKLSTLTTDQCQFAYRSSRFKLREHGRWFITSVTLKLSKQPMQPPFYRSLQSYLDEHKITVYSPLNIRQAVIDIRSQKLPDPSIMANTGSFFKNPIISPLEFKAIKAKHPTIPNFPTNEGDIKIPAGWLLEQAGYKGFRHPNGMGTYENHALVFVNYQAKRFDDLKQFKDEVQAKIKKEFDINLTVEPEII